MSSEQALIAELKAAEKALVGRRIAEVVYYGLGPGSGEWDFGSWHRPVMGVELVLDDGSSYSVVWDCGFGNCSLHLYASPMSEHLHLEGEGSGSRWTVQDHDRWKQLLTAPVIESRLIWHTDLTDWGQTAPAALRLGFPAGDVWIIAAMQSQNDSWWIGADEVIVAFTRDMVTQIGVQDPT
ncbi:hypothetical protein ACTOB_003428 [Actinoplanes oblitus]|uniref:Uncharacterized protein n=1 Tax=Actinoplanes oblitus TaxID=3040509 RepID=A0ABY8WRZ6_9ACTN|nr:hypothetical protein [Actinoplanes oblitus]WIM99766.1 hypothetical protein ACTOB_003428 [Actinoplanes oblitus]